MNCKLLLRFFTFAMILATALPLNAVNVWEPSNGYPIRQGWHLEWFRGGESRGEGQNLNEVAITWSDCRFGDRAIFTQVVNTNGALKFPENGLKVVDSTGRQEDPAVWPDVDGGWFFAWEDFDRWMEGGEARGDTLGDIYCTKIDANGNRVWGTERGVPVCTVTGIQESVRIVHDGQGGCIIAWLDKRGGDPNNIYAMHITSDGDPDPNWTRNGNIVVSEAGEQAGHTADIDGAGGMIIGWKDGREVGNSDIWAQRIQPDGTLLWGDGQGILVCNHPANQDAVKLCPDGRGGAFFTWVDDRNRQQTNKDIYAQRVNADGQLLWGAANEGSPLCTAEQEQVENRIIITEPGTAIVLWQDKRANGQEYDIYAQRINGENQMVKNWQPEQGRPVAVAPRNQQESRMYPDGQGGAFFVWEDERDGGFPEIDIWAQRLNVSGVPQWAENGVPVCRLADTQQAPLLRRTGDGGAFVAWADSRSGSIHLYGQKIRANGSMAWAENGVPLAAGLSQNATNQQIIPHHNGPNTFALVWSDARHGVRGTIPFIQLCEEINYNHVETLLPQDGIPMISANIIGGAISPRAFAAGNGEIITVWQDQRQGQNHSIYIQKTDATGEMTWGPSGIRVAQFEYDQALPFACSDGHGGAIIAWKAPTDDDYFDIYMQRISSAGQRMWTDRGLQLTGDEMDKFVEGIVSDGQGGAVVVWVGQDYDTDDDLYVQRVDANGNRLWSDAGGVALSVERNKQHYSVIAKHPAGFAVAWVDGRDEDSGQSQDDIYTQFIEMDGATRYRPNGASIFADENFHQLAPTITVDSGDFIWVAWEDNRHSGGDQQKDVYCQKFTAESNPDNHNYPVFLFNEWEARSVSSATSDQAVPYITSDQHGGVWLTWEDYRSGVWSDVYCTHLQPNGNPYPPFRANGNMVCDATHKQNGPVIEPIREDGDVGAVLLWEDKRATGKEELSNIFVQKVDDYIFDAPRESEPTLPRGYELESVYPNPFNDQALISFVTTGGMVIRLSIFDVNGRWVSDLASGSFDAGRHLVLFDGSQLAAGSYIVRMTVGETSVERTVQLLK